VTIAIYSETVFTSFPLYSTKSIGVMSFIGGSYRLRSGYDIAQMGFGTFLLKNQATINTAIDAALATGYRLFDTAKRYGNERELGIALEVGLIAEV
jgi:predicted aldo/keto reductase-like oxidoreductase